MELISSLGEEKLQIEDDRQIDRQIDGRQIDNRWMDGQIDDRKIGRQMIDR